MVKGKSGKAGKGGNRITLLRRAGAGGQWQKYVFLEGLDSPFGVQRVGITCMSPIPGTSCATATCW